MWGQLYSAAQHGFGHQELIIILIVVFILFGHRLPSVLRLLSRDPWENGPTRFRHDPNILWPTSLADWLVITVLVALLLAFLLPFVWYVAW